MKQLDVTIVTGMSGAGRSAAADALEDLGYFVIDNLPPALVGKVAELAAAREDQQPYALVVDVRSGEFVADLGNSLAQLRESGARTRVLFLDAADDVLVRRFENTRRRHPLAGDGLLSEGIAAERALVESLKGEADLAIDTSELNVHDLRARIRELFGDPGAPGSGIQVNIVSFGYKHGLPLDVDLVFDCRFLPNPHWVEALRPLSGMHPKVREYVIKRDEAATFLDQLDAYFDLVLPAFEREGKSYLAIGVGCTGGRHRSVAMGEELARRFERRGLSPGVHHRDVDRD